MKKIFNIIYIIDIVIIYSILFMFLLWSVFHTMKNFPPKMIAIIIFLSVILSFVSLMKILHKKANFYFLLFSILLPIFFILTPLYFIIPILAKAIPILEQQALMNGSDLSSYAPSLESMLSAVNSVITTHNFFSLEHVSLLLFNETIGLLIFFIPLLAIYSYGNHVKYQDGKKKLNKLSTKGLL